MFNLVIYCANDVASEKNIFQHKCLIYKGQISSEWFTSYLFLNVTMTSYGTLNNYKLT